MYNARSASIPDALTEAAGALREAATLTHEATLKNFLTLRAQALFAEAGYGLPNDLRVLNAVGARTGTYSNILKLRYDSTFRPIADAVLTDSDRSILRFEDIRDEVMFVRIFDSLGPQFVSETKQPIAQALRENASVANQIHSMLLSLWGHRYLIEHGYLDRRETASLYSAFLIPALARVPRRLGHPSKPGLDLRAQSPSRGRCDFCAC
jgi:hypothetical protein